MAYVGDDGTVIGDDVLANLSGDELNALGLDGGMMMGDDPLAALLAGDEELGGTRRRRPLTAAQRVALAARAAGMRTARQPTNMMPQDLPVPATAFLASETRTITLQPQRTFRMDRPAFPSSIASYFVLNDLTINQVSVFTAPGGVPCELYSEVAVGAQLYGQTVNQGAIIALNITNVDAGAPHTLRGALKGVAQF